jgi:hypothetical protein
LRCCASAGVVIVGAHLAAYFVIAAPSAADARADVGWAVIITTLDHVTLAAEQVPWSGQTQGDTANDKVHVGDKKGDEVDINIDDNATVVQQAKDELAAYSRTIADAVANVSATDTLTTERRSPRLKSPGHLRLLSDNPRHGSKKALRQTLGRSVIALSSLRAKWCWRRPASSSWSVHRGAAVGGAAPEGQGGKAAR